MIQYCAFMQEFYDHMEHGRQMVLDDLLAQWVFKLKACSLSIYNPTQSWALGLNSFSFFNVSIEYICLSTCPSDFQAHHTWRGCWICYVFSFSFYVWKWVFMFLISLKAWDTLCMSMENNDNYKGGRILKTNK